MKQTSQNWVRDPVGACLKLLGAFDQLAWRYVGNSLKRRGRLLEAHVAYYLAFVKFEGPIKSSIIFPEDYPPYGPNCMLVVTEGDLLQLNEGFIKTNIFPCPLDGLFLGQSAFESKPECLLCESPTQ